MILIKLFQWASKWWAFNVINWICTIEPCKNVCDSIKQIMIKDDTSWTCLKVFCNNIEIKNKPYCVQFLNTAVTISGFRVQQWGRRQPLQHCESSSSCCVALKPGVEGFPEHPGGSILFFSGFPLSFLSCSSCHPACPNTHQHKHTHTATTLHQETRWPSMRQH